MLVAPCDAQVKLEVIRLLHSPLFSSSPSAILPHLFVASTDSETRVSRHAPAAVANDCSRSAGHKVDCQCGICCLGAWWV